VKILAFTDSHGSPSAMKKLSKLAKAEKPDVIVCPGDFTIFDQHMNKILKQINNLGAPVLLIHGNHESEYLVKKSVKKFKNLIFIHKSFCRFGKYLFIGYGGGGFSLTNKSFTTWGEKIIKKAKKDDYIILLTHGPPFGTKLDLIMEDYCGNKDYRKFIMKNKIPLTFCGHIHETFNMEDKIGKGRVINPGPYGMIIKV